MSDVMAQGLAACFFAVRTLIFMNRKRLVACIIVDYRLFAVLPLLGLSKAHTIRPTF
jgi:hypothetical protein